MVMRRKIAPPGRVNIGNEVRDPALFGKVTLYGSQKGILITPYVLGDETRPECSVTVWGKSQRLFLPSQMRQKADMTNSDTVDDLFRDEDHSIMLVKSNNTCVFCGEQSEDMIEMPNGRLVCPRCRRILCSNDD